MQHNAKQICESGITSAAFTNYSAQEDFIPRDYQIELYQNALEENTIVYLPTGSGKTFIAALVIKALAHDVMQPLTNGGKRTIFLVPTVVLARQQANYLRRHTHLKVKEYYGSMGVDLWSSNRWQTEFENNQVLVMTAQIFVDILNHGYQSVSRINLLIFDECHAATKDAPMKQVLRKLDQCETSEQPRILGLTAALFRKRVKLHQVRSEINKLTESMKCVVKLPNDPTNIYKNCTKPTEYIIEYKDSGSAEWHPEVAALIDDIRIQITQITAELKQCSWLNNTNKDQGASTIKSSFLFTSLNETIYLLETFGPYGAHHSAVLYCNLMVRQISRVKLPKFRDILKQMCDFFQKIQRQCLECFNQFSGRDRQLKFISPQVAQLLKLLQRFDSNDPKTFLESSPLMCIIFVERRCMANVLYHFLKDISQDDPNFSFLRPLFTMGQALKSATVRESDVLDMKQKEVIDKFRQGICNLLVSTSVLEEGVDIPTCNLIIKFDPVKTYCDYVQSKGRARARKAFYCLMMNKNGRTPYIEMLAEFNRIEQLLLNSNFSDSSSRFDHFQEQFVPPYSPFGVNGPQITMQSSIALVNRYCSKLTSGCGGMEALAPQWTVTEVAENRIDDTEWLAKIQTVLAKSGMPTENPAWFQCQLMLPLNSPMRDIVTGKAMPSKRLAKRSAALQLCIRLHEMKELDDEHLLPIELEDLESEYFFNEDNDNDGSGAVESNQFYERHFPDVFRNCLPRCGSPCFIYAVRFHSRGVESMPIKLGILSSLVIPQICQFPIFTRSGEYLVEILDVDCVVLDQTQIDDLVKFHRFLFEDVIFLFKQQLSLDVHDPHLQCLIVPLTVEGIDFEFARRIINAPKIDWDRVPTQQFTFCAERYADAVVVPWYQPMGKLLPYYVDAISGLMLFSPFPDEQYPDFHSYFHRKYDLTMSNSSQPLLKCSRELTGKNFLVPRTTNAESKITYLVPELVYIHALPASVWKQTVLIPSVLHRLNGLLVAEEFRLNFVHQTNIGIDRLPNNGSTSTIWKPMNAKKITASSAQKLSNKFSPIDSREQVKSSQRNLDPCADPDSLWNLDLFEADQCSPISEESPPDISKAIDCHNLQITSSVKVDPRSNLSFDQPNPREYSEYGPSPAYILEALTMARADDGFSMERLETIGDSFLKLATSIYVYGQSAARNFNEGFLSKMRSSRICNKHLFKLGSKIKLEQLLSAHRLDIARNFIPPCFKVPATNEKPDGYLQQSGISEKNIADSVEALIGVYLLTTGTKGAMAFLNWIGLKTFPEEGENRDVNPTNGFPIIDFSPSTLPLDKREEMIAFLFTGLESLEAKIHYTFKNKALLIEALTHASFYPNRVTGCFQRLEFLGDAVLDYLVTRYYYDDPLEYSPAILTDLRSATVNNEMFAVLSVRNGFHLYLKHLSVTVNSLLDCFVRTQEQNGHKLMHNHFRLVYIDEYPYASNVETPKVLGDIFESVAGAIFIDSGMSLDAVWQSYSPFLLEEIDKFYSNIPKSPVRILHELYPGKIKSDTQIENERLCVSISIEGTQDVFKGIGRNTRFAKSAAAKYALYKLCA